MFVSFVATWIAVSCIWSLALLGSFDFYTLGWCAGSATHLVACAWHFFNLPVIAPFAVALFSDNDGILFLWITAVAFPILSVSIFSAWEFLRPIMPNRPSKH